MVTGKPRVMVFSAHAADFCSRSGGTIANYVKYGSQVRVVDLTFGERGESGSLYRDHKGITVEEVKRIREKEARSAAAVLGAEIRFMDFDDNPLIVDKPRFEKLVEEIREFKPDIVLTHWLRDPQNPDHATTSDAVIKACQLSQIPGVKPGIPTHPYPMIYLFEPSVPTNEISDFRPDVYIDITGVFGVKLKALMELRTQSDLPRWYTLYGELRGFQARGGFPSYYRGKLSSPEEQEREIKYAEAFKAFLPWVGVLFPFPFLG